MRTTRFNSHLGAGLPLACWWGFGICLWSGGVGVGGLSAFGLGVSASDRGGVSASGLEGICLRSCGCLPLVRHPPGQISPWSDTILGRHPLDRQPLSAQCKLGYTHHLNRITDRCKSITFSQLRLPVVTRT